MTKGYNFLFVYSHKTYALVIGLPGKGDPGTTGGNQLKLKKSAPQYQGLSGLLGLFLARGLGTFSGVSGWLPLPLLTRGSVNMFLIFPGWRLCFQIMPEGSEN